MRSFIHTTRKVAEEALIRSLAASGGGGGGITQLTGDVLAGPGVGSVPATVVRVNGATVPAAGALTTGNVLQVTGVSALGYAPVNLAGGPNFVTGTLPSGNLPALAGDVTGAPNTNTVVKITGAAGVAVVPNGTDLAFQFAAGTPSVSGRINFTKNAQQFLAYQDTTGADHGLVTTDGNDDLEFGSRGAGAVVRFLGGFSAALQHFTSGNNITIASAGVVENATTHTVNSTPYFFDSASNVQVGGVATTAGSGTGVLGITNATANPSTNPVGGGVLYATAGTLVWRGSGGTVTVLAPA